MKGTVIQFRRGRHVIHERHFILDLSLKNKTEASKFVGKTVIWESPGKQKKAIKGSISASHGNRGLVRAIFERGLPGQAIGTEVEVKA